MKCLILVTSSILLATLVAVEGEGLSQTNLHRLKRAALRRNTGQSPKVPKFGWGKRGSDVQEYNLPGAYGHPEKRNDINHEFTLEPRQDWTVGDREKLNDLLSLILCEWYGCHPERSDWESEYGKPSGPKYKTKPQHANFNDDRGEEKGDQGKGNRWSSNFGRWRR